MAANRIVQEMLNEEEEVPRMRQFKDIMDPFDGLSDLEIYNRYHFPPNVILEITDLIKEQVEHPTNRSRAIPPLIQVCTMLRYLASNSFQQVVGDTFGVSKSSSCRSIWRCLRALIQHLPNFIKFPNGQELMHQKQKFFEKAQFPRVIGLIDGTHIRIIPPAEFENFYVNQKSFHSLNIQGVCDADGYFTHLTAMWPGSAHDARIFNESALRQNLEEGEHIGHLLGDSGYGCKLFLLTPYLIPSTPAQERYNNAHKKTRVLIEQVFGRWKRRFSILHGEVRVKHDRVPLVVICCAMLHNLAVKYRLPDLDNIEENFEDEIPDFNVQNVENGLRYRDAVTQTFFA